MSKKTGKDDLSRQPQSRKLLFCILFLALIIRVGGMVVLHSWEVADGDRYGFRDGEIAAALAAGQGFSWPDNSGYNMNRPATPTAWQAPGYPFIIAFFFKLFGVFSPEARMVLILFQCVLAVLICWLLFLLGVRAGDGRAGLFAAFIAAGYPPAIHLSIEKVSSSSLFVLLLLLFIYLCLRLKREPGPGNSLLTGVVFGAAALTDPVIFALLPFALAWLLAGNLSEIRKHAGAVLLVILALCLILAPWQIRNYLVFDQLFLVKSNFSRELFRGNSMSVTDSIEEQKYRTVHDEGETGRIYWKKSLEDIAGNPAKILKNSYYRFILFWTQLPRESSRAGKPPGFKEAVAGAGYLFVLGFGLGGLLLQLYRGGGLMLPLLAVISLPVPYYLTWFSHFRYRFPAEVILMLFAGFAVCRIWEGIRDRVRAGSM